MKSSLGKKINVAILGASGYVGGDLVRILYGHEHVSIEALSGYSSVDLAIGDIFPHLLHCELPRVELVEKINWGKIDTVFCALPHSESQSIIVDLPESVRIVDLSADFRLRDVAVYSEWYGHEHVSPELQELAVYGLSEHYRDLIRGARLVACPGCYPTAALLMLLPLLRGGMIDAHDIVIDAKSGISGAGRGLKRGTLFCETGESMGAYGLGSHRHMPEIEQELSLAAGESIRVSFSPHLVPMSRGEYLTTYATLAGGYSCADVREHLLESYRDEYFVRVSDGSRLPSTSDVRGSNFCHLAVAEDRIAGRVILLSTIDNLVKGSAGQAVQNFNIMHGFDEKLALDQLPLFP